MVPYRRYKKDWEHEMRTLQLAAPNYVNAEIFCFSTMASQIFQFFTKYFAAFWYFNVHKSNFTSW